MMPAARDVHPLSISRRPALGRIAALASAIAFCALSLGCKRSARDDGQATPPSVENALPPASDEEGDDDDDGEIESAASPLGPAGAGHCEPLVGGAKLRGDAEKKIAAEFGGALSLGGGRFAVGYLLAGAENRAGLALVDVGEGAGLGTPSPPTLRSVHLGAGHGPVEPPRLAREFASSDDGGVIVGVVASDATSGTVRLARVDTSAAVTWGPEVRSGRAESDAFSIARAAGPSGALLVWDRFDRTTLRSALFALPFDPRTMRATRSEFRLSGLGEDLDAPLLVPRKEGYLLLAQRYESGPLVERGAGKAGDLGLVDEPPRTLSVFQLDGSGRVTGEAVELVSSAAEGLVFDAVLLGSGELLVALRVSGAEGAPLRLLRLGADGSVHEETVPARSLGSGALTLLSAGAGAWLGAHDPGGHALLLAVAPSGNPLAGFLAERGWGEVYPLAGSGELILAARPSGLDIELLAARCRAPTEGAPKPGAR